MITITMERYEELVKAEHACEIIKKYIGDDTYISTTLMQVILGLMESEEK